MKKKQPLSLVFYALSDPARLEIIRQLLLDGETSCGGCKSSLSKSTMSHHFKVLKDSGLIKKRTAGKIHYISICVDEINERVPGLLNVLKKCKSPL